MKIKTKKILAAASALGFAALFPLIGLAGPNDRELPAEDDLFWQVTSAMNRPDDTTACQAAIDQLSTAQLLEYASQHADEGQGGPQQGSDQQGEQGSEDQQNQTVKQGFYQMCAMIAQMPAEMETDMAGEGVTSNLFDMPDWHHVSGLYFEKTGQGKISFTNTLDFLSYRFFRFMSNFDRMVGMESGYISLNASMVPDMKNYGAQLTMYGLNLGDQQPDIYVDGKLAGTSDVADITYNAGEGSLTFTAKHFSAYKAVAHGSKIKPLRIRKVNPKSVKYNAHKRTFRIKVHGSGFKKKGATVQCSLGFEQATRVSIGKNGKLATCLFTMSDFSDLGTFPLTLSVDGAGEATKINAVRVK